MIELDLIWPPALNRYYRNVHGRTIISSNGRAYQRAVAGLAMAMDRAEWPLTGRLSVEISAYPPDMRRRDVDGMLKAMLDALTHAGVWEDDSQIDALRIVRRKPVDGGKMIVQIMEI